MKTSWNSGNAEGAQTSALRLRGKTFLLLVIRHEEARAFVIEGQIIDAQHAHSQADLRANRIERRIESFFGDAEIREPYRKHSVFAPDEQLVRALDRYDLEGARAPEAIVGLNLAVRRINNRLEGRELRIYSELNGILILLGKFQLVRRIDLRVELDRLHRRAGESQRVGSIAALGQRFDLQRSRERVGIVLQRDDPQHGGSGGIDQHDAAFEKPG